MNLRRPLGLAVSGGGALGAWEMGLLHAWKRAGVEFDRAWGFSAGSLCAASWALDRMEPSAEVWRNMDKNPILRLSPGTWPGTIFSDKALAGLLDQWVDEDSAQNSLLSDLYVVTFDVETQLPFTAKYERGGHWEGALKKHILASCAIPHIFPPVVVQAGGRNKVLVDGGVPGKKFIDLEPLKDCADVIVVSVTHPSEMNAWPKGPLHYLNLKGKRMIQKQMENGIDSLSGNGTRIHRVHPGRPIQQSFLNFSGPKCRRLFDRGLGDGAVFLDRLVAEGSTS